MFIDAKVILGETRVFSSTIKQLAETGQGQFNPLNLMDYAIKFKVLGAPQADAKVLVEHIITQFTDPEEGGQITNAPAGEFEFTITAEDTRKLGVGKFPIMIELVDPETFEHIDTITQGGKNGEFNKIFVIQV